MVWLGEATDGQPMALILCYRPSEPVLYFVYCQMVVWCLACTDTFTPTSLLFFLIRSSFVFTSELWFHYCSSSAFSSIHLYSRPLFSLSSFDFILNLRHYSRPSPAYCTVLFFRLPSRRFSGISSLISILFTLTFLLPPDFSNIFSPTFRHPPFSPIFLSPFFSHMSSATSFLPILFPPTFFSHLSSPTFFLPPYVFHLFLPTSFSHLCSPTFVNPPVYIHIFFPSFRITPFVSHLSLYMYLYLICFLLVP